MNSDFSVELETEEVLSKAVDQLISKAGSDKLLTGVLVDFALEKTEDDKSYNLAYDFNRIAKLLINENHFRHLKELEGKSLKNFSDLKKLLNKRIKKIEVKISEDSGKILKLIADHDIDHNDFKGPGGSVPTYFKKLQDRHYKINFDRVWMEAIETDTLYPKSLSPEKGEQIDSIQRDIALVFNKTRRAFHERKLLKSMHKNLIPVSVLNLIYQEVELIKSEENLVLISEFNSMVSEHLRNQPAAFIYERIGEKYKHFFIDEFQDTSVLQWENLIPLIDNALSGENATATLVGDAKQAIYRWRGGRAEQFIKLFEKEDNPFQINPAIHNLEFNYRSHKDIVEFNNDFFQHLSDTLFNSSIYRSVYSNCNQIAKSDLPGYVHLSFLEYEKAADSHPLYGQVVAETINECLIDGFKLRDICILTRTREQGIHVASYLSENTTYNFVSSESLLLINSSKVRFVIDLLELLNDTSNLEVKFEVLYFLSGLLVKEDNRHEFISQNISLDMNMIFENLRPLGVEFSFSEVMNLPLYEALEYILYEFSLIKESDAYLQALLDEAYDFASSKPKSKSGFVDHFRSRAQKLSIKFPSEVNAIQIMTIHKAKGLEFPIVILPYADLELYREKDAKAWYPVDPLEYDGFDRVYVDFSKYLSELDDTGQAIYNSRRMEMELDTINLLYVAFTRPIEQLHIICKKRINSKGEASNTSTAGLLIRYLKGNGIWNDHTLEYSFGKRQGARSHTDEKHHTLEQGDFAINPKKNLALSISTRAGSLWDSRQEKAIEKGNLIHDIMATIKTNFDVEPALDHNLRTGALSGEQASDLKLSIDQIITHPLIKDYYTDRYSIYNERQIITSKGKLLRPDRVAISFKDDVTIIDYKTGSENEEHVKQIVEYSEAIEEMGLLVEHRYLVYIDTAIQVKEV
ncbi:MAG: UvrD-helicase domain-containing protein [Bacteroidia bacterium]|nr:UvrD-helicase domain-containing protein [Bacteroidia bacterium]